LLEQIEKLKEGDFDESLIKAIVANYKLSQLNAMENNNYRVEDIVDEFIKNRGQEWDQNVALLDQAEKITRKRLLLLPTVFLEPKTMQLSINAKAKTRILQR
jgi:hypothetical protein